MFEIKDSGERREFETGAVRDMSAGKGRCDLLPLDIIACMMQDAVLTEIASFVQTKKELYLIRALSLFQQKAFADMPTMILELAKHFEAGAEKYGEYNWQKGLPLHCYIDSGVRHYLKWLRGDEDEPHDRAFAWNMVCAVWTVKNKPEMDDIYGPKYTLEEIKAELRVDDEGVRVSPEIEAVLCGRTYLEDFCEKLPNAPLSESGIPKCCRGSLYGGKCRSDRDCWKCWCEVMPTEKL